MSYSEEGQNDDIALSVIIPCYNQGEFILEAIASVENCQDPVYEIIIVNDGSTEPLTEKVLNYLKDKGYNIVEQSNQGLAEARNTGIKIAKGRYILPVDADNKIKANYITKIVEILDKNPEVGVVYGNAELFGEKTSILQVPEFDINRIVKGNYIDACAGFRKVVWKDCSGYDSKIPRKLGYEDWDLWLGAAEKGWQFYHIDEVLFEYRYRADSMVSQCNIPENRRELIEYICTKHIGLYATNFANVFGEIAYDLLKERGELDYVQRKLQKTQLELALSRSQLEETKLQLLEIKAQMQETQNVRKQLETQIKDAQAEFARSQVDRKKIEAEVERSQMQLKQRQADFQAEIAEKEQRMTELQAQLQTQLQTQLQQTQAHFQAELAEKERSHNQLQVHLQQTQAEHQQCLIQLQKTQAERQHCLTQLQQTQAERENLQATIAAMLTSKFWKLRTRWFKLKKTLGLGNEV